MAEWLAGTSATWPVGGRTRCNVDEMRVRGPISFLIGPLEDEQAVRITVQKSVVNAVPARIDGFRGPVR